ncbi:hypothetical protein X797_010298 [Metarhizium robertsii]|uniref:NAD dependent epimerase/dehydratase n=2 Tax=Metarhizium robertsii TaxID=568076 RepID=E9FC88_METRA|nr:NAD dependent epimerase/dehydratase [Metarhizium robertsii ARSEF 23]EFY94666.1 NAD dependent epimerase/dehydratase [Metarhizium robertsii ARSEF 23]EXU96622.1 hypothetical protein X797_010298 [Metarhizium robertsii]
MHHSSKYKPKPFTDIFTPDTDINRSKCVRTVPMKVLILGLDRTGTASLRAAMKRLGYLDTYHMTSCLENPPDALLWTDALCAKYDGAPRRPFTRRDWDRLLGHCQAVSGWPAAAFAADLIAAYPEAKVVLTTRDVDAWHASALKTVYWRATDPELGYLSRVDWAAGMYYPLLRKLFDTFFEGDFAGRGKEVFRRHCEEVRRLVPGDRLLEYQVTEGWGPLCKFLGEPVPEHAAFPNVNDDEEFVRQSRRRNRDQMRNVAFRILVWLLVMLFAIGLVCRVFNVGRVVYTLAVPLGYDVSQL